MIRHSGGPMNTGYNEFTLVSCIVYRRWERTAKVFVFKGHDSVLKTPCSIQTTIDTMQRNTNKLTFDASPKGKVKGDDDKRVIYSALDPS